MIRSASLAAFVILLSATSAVAEQYVCIAEHTTGFRYNRSSESWSPVTFLASKKLVVTVSKSSDYEFEVKTLGSKYDFPEFTCEDAFNEYGYLFCEGFGEFRMNKNTLRFQSYYPIGYVAADFDEEHQATNNPSLTIGKCSSF